MVQTFRILTGLPAYGPPALPFPVEWGTLGREGFVVEFEAAQGDKWVGNFGPLFGCFSTVLSHPDGIRILVVAGGTAWAINLEERSGSPVIDGVEGVWPLVSTSGHLLDLEGLTIARLEANGILWQTRRISWDGFDEVSVGLKYLTGLSWNPLDEEWQSFAINIETGAATGGSFSDVREGRETPQSVRRWLLTVFNRNRQS